MLKKTGYTILGRRLAAFESSLAWSAVDGGENVEPFLLSKLPSLPAGRCV